MQSPLQSHETKHNLRTFKPPRDNWIPLSLREQKKNNPPTHTASGAISRPSSASSASPSITLVAIQACQLSNYCASHRTMRCATHCFAPRELQRLGGWANPPRALAMEKKKIFFFVPGKNEKIHGRPFESGSLLLVFITAGIPLRARKSADERWWMYNVTNAFWRAVADCTARFVARCVMVFGFWLALVWLFIDRGESACDERYGNWFGWRGFRVGKCWGSGLFFGRSAEQDHLYELIWVEWRAVKMNCNEYTNGSDWSSRTKSATIK